MTDKRDASGVAGLESRRAAAKPDADRRCAFVLG
jgi:hypothetical protein